MVIAAHMDKKPIKYHISRNMNYTTEEKLSKFKQCDGIAINLNFNTKQNIESKSNSGILLCDMKAVDLIGMLPV